jgi:hypothetical protein
VTASALALCVTFSSALLPPFVVAVIVTGRLDAAALESWGKYPALRVVATTHEDERGKTALASAFTAAGFGRVACELPPDFETRTVPSRVVLQMAQVHAGLAWAEAAGATHALRIRSDVLVRDAARLVDAVFSVEGGGRRRLSLLAMFDPATIGIPPSEAPLHPTDPIVGGPLQAVRDFFDASVSAQDHRNAEVVLMEGFARRHALASHEAFCRSVHWLLDELPLGLVEWRGGDYVAWLRDLAKISQRRTAAEMCRPRANATTAGSAERCNDGWCTLPEAEAS